MRSSGLVVTVATLTLAAGGAHAGICSQPTIARTATLVLEAQRTLNAIPVSADKQTNVSVAARKAITTMKARLNDYTVATLRCAPEAVIASDSLKSVTPDLRETLATFAGVKIPEMRIIRNTSPVTHSYGDGPVFDVRRLRSDAIGIVARFGIECGEDAMLMIFEYRRGTWAETLRTQSGTYKSVSGGWWSFDYGISPRDKDGHWFVVTKNVAPWCSSTWSEIRYEVLRPGTGANHPRTLFSKTDDIWWGPDRFGDLKVSANGFDLRWPAESMDSDVLNREWIARYVVEDNRVIRDAPIAESPRDFVDEWLRLDWKDAKHWTAVVDYGLKPLHDRLRKQHYFTYDAVRRCSDGDHTQIEVEPAEGDMRHVFFQVFGNKLLQMGDVGFTPDPHCKGPNLFDMNKAQ